MRRSVFILVLSICMMLVWRCAQIMPLTGGPRDVKPPAFTGAVPSQNAINFAADEIVLSFDEYVQVKNLSNQLIVSPKLKSNPEITAEGKKIVIKLKKEELKPNTTYRFSFGRAIADMNESNAIPGFDYVFSTGGFVDTLRVRGTVSDAFTNKLTGDILVGLYPPGNENDSVVFKREAEYIARSNDQGEFEFKNLPETDFRVYAIADKNKNGSYDGESEKVAFFPGTLHLTKDTSLHLRIFQEIAPRTYIKKVLHPYFGFTQIVLNKKARVELSTLDPGLRDRICELKQLESKDTIALFYDRVQDSLNLVIKAEGWTKIDTLKLKLPRKPAAGRNKLKTISSNLSLGTLPLGAKVRLSFFGWMDTTRVRLSGLQLTTKEDSVISTLPVTGKWVRVDCYELEASLKEGKTYHLKLDTAVFYDRLSLASDSANFTFKTQSKTDYGKLTLNVMFSKKQQYLLELINEKNEVVREHAFGLSLASSNAMRFDFNDLLPGMYRVRLVFDNNQNNKWDSGDVMKQLLPERIEVHSKQLKVISDWEVEEEIFFKD